VEEGEWSCSEEGTPQGGSASPLLANIYLHYVFDLWCSTGARQKSKGDVIVVRWADDFVVGFEHQADAARFHHELASASPSSKLKTASPENARHRVWLLRSKQSKAAWQREAGDIQLFWGFTHICGKKRSGMFTVYRRTMSKRKRAKLKEVKTERATNASSSG
jgi:hypothetical protein